MVEKSLALTPHSSKNDSLTQGLVRNTAFNLLGWVWPIGLAIVSVPYIVTKLGNDAYGIFSIVSIVAGYLGLLNSPVAMGNVRFLAVAYANEEWSELRKVALGGLIISGTLSLIGALVMFLAADTLVKNVFAIPATLVGTAVIAFRLASLSFVLNGMISALQSIPTAMRRYDILNQAGLVVGTLNTMAIIFVLWRGWGLLGTVTAQVFTSIAGLILFSVVAFLLLRKIPGSERKSLLSSTLMKRLASFSSLLFAGQVASQIGLQIDRTLIGILLGTSDLAFYTVPTRITDRIPSMMYFFSTALYPLSSEAMATDKIDELRQLYHEMVRILFWLSAFIATPLVILAREFMMLWIGPEFMANSWFVLVVLASAVVWRSPGAIAYQVCNGMGRADITLIASIGTAVFMTVPVLILIPSWGALGVAIGVFIGLFISNLAFYLFTQARLLGDIRWGESLSLYIRIILVEAGTILSFHVIPVELAGWFGLIVKAGMISLIYIALSLIVGVLRTRDIKYIAAKVLGIFK